VGSEEISGQGRQPIRGQQRPGARRPETAAGDRSRPEAGWHNAQRVSPLSAKWQKQN
jgi:hypothetical protein